MSKRLRYLDIFRSLGIIIMVMGHVGFGSRFDKFIHAFHMPMFFIISGFLWKPAADFKQFLIKKAKTLLLPYLFFGLIHVVLVSMFRGFEFRYISALFWVNTTGNLPIADALWFLTALFSTYVIYFFLDKSRFKLPLIILVSVFGTIVGRFITLPFGLGQAFMATGLFFFGEMIKRYEDKLLDLKLWQVLVLGAAAVVLIFSNSRVNVRIQKYSIIPLYYVNAFLATLVGMNLSKLAEPHLPSALSARLSGIGENSVVYVSLNELVIHVLSLFVPLVSVSAVVLKPVILLLAMAVLYCFELLMTRTSLCVFIGRKKCRNIQ